MGIAGACRRSCHFALALVVLAIFSPSCRPAQHASRVSLGTPEHRPDLLTLQGIKATIAAAEKRGVAIKTGQAYLSYLKKNFPKTLQNFVLVHKSGGIQRATPLLPRVILFEPGSAMMSFVVDHETGACDAFEILEIPSSPGPLFAREVVFRTNQEPLYEHEPKGCIACHSERIKPLFETYSTWPGIYGGDLINIAEESEELSMFRKFLDGYRQQRSWSRPFTKSIAHSKWGCYQLFDSETTGIEAGGFRKGITFKRESASRLNDVVHQANIMRVVGLLKSLQDIDHLIFAILAAAKDCADYESIFPARVAAALPPFAETLHETLTWESRHAARVKHEMRLLYPNFEFIGGEFFPLHQVRPVAKMRYLLENMGISMENWSTVHFPKTYSFMSSGGDGIRSLYEPAISLLPTDIDREKLQILRQVVDRDALRNNNTEEIEKAQCEILTSQAQMRLTKIPIARWGKTDFRTQAGKHFGTSSVLTRCMSCHDQFPVETNDGDVPPLISFPHTMKWAEQLRANNSDLLQSTKDRIRGLPGRGRMPPPPWHPLTQPEIIAMEDVMQRVAEGRLLKVGDEASPDGEP